MGRRVYSAEFKHEAVRLVRERGVSVAHAAADLGIHVNVLRSWIKAVKKDSKEAFPGRGRQKPDDAEVARLRRELAKTKTERDILKKAAAFFAKERR